MVRHDANITSVLVQHFVQGSGDLSRIHQQQRPLTKSKSTVLYRKGFKFFPCRPAMHNSLCSHWTSIHYACLAREKPSYKPRLKILHITDSRRTERFFVNLVDLVTQHTNYSEIVFFIISRGNRLYNLHIVCIVELFYNEERIPK